MLFLTCITYLSFLIQGSFITIAIAAGLYYFAELVEEYSNSAKKCIWWMNMVITILFVFLWIFENFPTHIIICGILAQLIHFLILKDFPFVSFISPTFIIGLIFLIINHYFAFKHFGSVYFSFSEVMAYFTLYLWLVPFSLFVSLSANDNVLPTTLNRPDSDVVSNYLSKRNKKYGLLSLFNYAKETLLPVRAKKGF